MSLNTGKPTPVHLPAATIGSAVADIPLELGYVTASITADAVWTLPPIQQATGSIVEGSALTVHNPTFFTITLVPSGSDLIDAVASIIVLANSTAVLFSTFTGWCLSSNDVNNSSYVDPFHGWWINTNKGGSTWNTLDTRSVSVAIFIDTTKNPIELTSYSGTIDAIREMTPTDGVNKVIQLERVDANTLQWVVDDIAYYGVRPSFRLQSDKNVMAGSANMLGAWIGAILPYIFNKLSTPPVVRPYSAQDRSFPGQTSYDDCSNPVFMFDEICNIQLTQQPMTNPKLGFEQYPGYLAVKGHQQLMKTIGVSYSASIAKIQRTTVDGHIAAKTQPSPTRFITVIICVTDVHVYCFSNITISGCVGPLAPLNGAYRIVCLTNNAFIDTDNNYMNPATREYTFAIEFDSRAYAADALGYLTDSLVGATVSVTHGPVTPSTQYPDLLDALYEMFKFTFQFSTHSHINYWQPSSSAYGDQLRTFDTYADLQVALRAGTVINPDPWFQSILQGSGMYDSFFSHQLGGVCCVAQAVPLNSPFQINAPNTASIWNYNIPLNNYLDKTPGFEPRNIWWRLTGVATTPSQQLAGLTYYNNPNLGQTFEAITWPISAGVPPPAATVDEQYFQLANSVRNSFGNQTAQRYIFGRINPAFTGGQNIGYVRLSTVSMADPFIFMNYSDLAPAPPAFPIDTKTGNPRANVEAMYRVFSEGMRYIRTTLGCTKCIINIRCNFGGDPSQCIMLSSWFGADRLGYENVYAKQDNGFSNILQAPGPNIYDYDIYNNVAELGNTVVANILPSLNNTFYPGSTFQVPGSKVHLLTDQRAASGGNLIPILFLGDNLDRDLGGGVTCKIFGDMNGILCGSSATRIYQTTSPTSFIVTEDDGETPIPFLSVIVEGMTIGNKLPQAEFSTQRRPDIAGYKPLKPDTPAAPVNYLGAGPWPNNWESNAYQDLGGVPYTLPAGLRLPGDVRANPNPLPTWPLQPVPADRLLWRDCWLEQVVLDAMQP